MNDVLATLPLIRRGVIVELARTRFRGMPQLSGHPQFELVSYRTPQGLRIAGEEPWASGSGGCSGFASELMIGTAHTGTHIDALAHVSAADGDTDRWHGGGSTREHLGDFGPQVGDAAELVPVWARGVLLDVAAHRGVDALGKGEAVTGDELEEVARSHGVAVGEGDVVLLRTGYLSRWPDAERMREIEGAGPDLSAARWLASRGVRATGSDTESYEVIPPVDEGRFPVHAHLIVERGILIMECLDLEGLAKEGVHEFLFVALPLKIRGATGSMIDPVAVL